MDVLATGFAEKRPRGRWKPGESGNPAGRRQSPAAVLYGKCNERIAEAAWEALQVLIDVAQGRRPPLGEQELQIALWLLNRIPRPRQVLPPLRLPAEASLAERVEGVKRAMLRGEIDPWTAQAALSALLAGADRSTAPGDWQTDPMIPDIPKREPDEPMH